jgi:hypothetical protein
LLEELISKTTVILSIRKLSIWYYVLIWFLSVFEKCDADPTVGNIPVHTCTSDSKTVVEPTCTFSTGLSPAGKQFFLCWMPYLFWEKPFWNIDSDHLL